MVAFYRGCIGTRLGTDGADVRWGVFGGGRYVRRGIKGCVAEGFAGVVEGCHFGMWILMSLVKTFGIVLRWVWKWELMQI